jgi:hypothetical protein
MSVHFIGLVSPVNKPIAELPCSENVSVPVSITQAVSRIGVNLMKHEVVVAVDMKNNVRP